MGYGGKKFTFKGKIKKNFGFVSTRTTIDQLFV